MVPIKIKDYVKKHIATNKDTDINELTTLLEDAVKRKQSGGKCSCCNQPIWALGSAVSGFEGCFTCITGETDDSVDYEVELF